DQVLRRAQDTRVTAFGKRDSRLLAPRFSHHDAHYFVRASLPLAQLLDVLAPVEPDARGARLHRRLRDGGSDGREHARVEGLGDDVIAAEAEVLPAVSGRHALG